MPSGFAKLPDYLRGEIAHASSEGYVFGTVRPWNATQRAEVADRLGLTSQDGGYQGIPSRGIGRWSRWNVTGRIIIRRDLPKITKSWSFDRPNWGDDSRGYHTISWAREIYPRDEVYGEQLEARIVPAPGREETHSLAFVIRVLTPRETVPAGPTDELYAASLCREWYGAAHALNTGDDQVPEIPDEHVEWEFFPPGTAEDIETFVRDKLGERTTEADVSTTTQRLVAVQTLNPRSRIYGASGLNRYIGFLFGDDFVVFENPRAGNALYILFEDWQTLSQLSRRELLASRTGEFSRIIHSADWLNRLEAEVYNYRIRASASLVLQPSHPLRRKN